MHRLLHDLESAGQQILNRHIFQILVVGAPHAQTTVSSSPSFAVVTGLFVLVPIFARDLDTLAHRRRDRRLVESAFCHLVEKPSGHCRFFPSFLEHQRIGTAIKYRLGI